MARKRKVEGEAPAPKRERAKGPSKREQLAALVAEGLDEAKARLILGMSARGLTVTVKVRLPRDVWVSIGQDPTETVEEALVRLATAEAGELATRERVERDAA